MKKRAGEWGARPCRHYIILSGKRFAGKLITPAQVEADSAEVGIEKGGRRDNDKVLLSVPIGKRNHPVGRVESCRST